LDSNIRSRLEFGLRFVLLSAGFSVLVWDWLNFVMQSSGVF